MKLYPTSTATNLAFAGAALVGVGLVAGHPPMVGWGAALVVGLAIARAGTLVSVARIRAAGFEMLWSTTSRTARVSRGGEVTLEAEVRNRDTLAARYVGLRAIASSQLEVSLDPPEGEVPASGRLRVSVKVKGPRVGRHGVFGLSLEVRGAPGLFEVPLTFANPFGIEVMPASYATHLGTACGGRTRIIAESGRAGRFPGEGSDIRELREHRPGDPFKRIAWRASARRGKLMVREMEQEERDVVWVVLDASVELWAGRPGEAPLDLAIDDAAEIVDRHVRRGDKVGLLVVASRVRSRIEPGRGPAHAARIHAALAHAASTYDRDRSELDEADVASRVAEHLRPLDVNGLADVSRRDLDKLVVRANAVASRAPFSPDVPDAPSQRERRLRHYLASFGIESPPRAEPEGTKTMEVLARTLADLTTSKPRASIVYVTAPAYHAGNLEAAIRRLARRGIATRWVLPRFEPSLRGTLDGRTESAVLVRAASIRAAIQARRATRFLHRLGVRVERPRGPRHRANDVTSSGESPP